MPQKSLLRGALTPAPRTLVDIFLETVEAVPEAPAIDNAAEVLTYADFAEAAGELADELAEAGIGPGDKVGVRIASGTTDLYVAIMGILLAGAAYVPVDADDPDERARTVFEEASVAAVVGADLAVAVRRPGAVRDRTLPTTADDAWVIFTSGSTGKPKGVAVTHRNAAAFVDAEARLFLTDDPIGVGDRVMAGLSVAFDASCEEMWLAWRYGACLVPAPRSLVRSGMELAPWLTANTITVVSTVPTLLALWPVEALERVRLLILGGEAMPPELGVRFARPGRELWNTYGPTEATVVACAAQVGTEGPVRIGLPLDGWDLAVVDGDGQLVAEGESGELIIGGVGLARYLDPVKDAEKYAPMPTLGWERAYRSGDVVRFEEAGLLFAGRADDQVKVGGRRIELGEIDSALSSLPGVVGAAAAVRSTDSGNKIIVGYVIVDDSFEVASALSHLRAQMPAALVPRLAGVDVLPTRTSGKIDRDALPWPAPMLRAVADQGWEPAGTEAVVAVLWREILGAEISSAADDFFDLGGGSLSAAQLVSRLRATHPEVTVGDVYETSTLGRLAGLLDSMAQPSNAANETVNPVPFKTQAGQITALLGLRAFTGLRWLTWGLFGARLIDPALPEPLTLPQAPWWLVGTLVALLLTPPGRLGLTALLARVILSPVTPGDHPRGGKVHLRVWLAERIADELGAGTLSCAPWLKLYARLLGARIGKDVDLHALPPVTGHLQVGEGASIEPEVDLTGHWVDGGTFHLGEIRVRSGARIGTRSMLLPGADVGRDAEVAPGSAVFGTVGKGESWAGAPAVQTGRARGAWSDDVPVHRWWWTASYALLSLVIASFPVVATAVGVALTVVLVGDPGSWGSALLRAFAWIPVTGTLGLGVLALSILMLVRALGAGVRPGHHAIGSVPALCAWGTLRVLDEARTWLFPLYSGALTPVWLRLLGARIGSEVEASTVLMIPKLVTVNDGAFLADDTLVGGYELGGGWLRVEHSKIGKRAFLGNSGMTAPGRRLRKQSLVAVLSAAPGRDDKMKAGTSWLGSPPVLLRRQAGSTDDSRTYAPSRRLKIYRGLVETCRFIPVWLSIALAAGVIVALVALTGRASWLAVLLSGVVVLAAGLLAALSATAAKWLLVGRFRTSEHPLWSGFVWRSELADTFVETLAAPWLASAAPGTPLLNLWLRTMGARIGRGVWCETYWLPEADLVELADGSTVNQGCVVQTHLFHDRVLSMDTVTLRRGATLGPNSVVLPAATIGRHATVGPVSLMMRGESVPDKTRWIGNPIGPWIDEDAR